MSTRCNIIISGVVRCQPVLLYRHCDGYPENTGVELKRLVEKYSSENQYATPCDFATYLIRYRKKCNPDFAILYASTDGYILSYELAASVQSDIDFLYFIDLTQKSVRCCRANAEIWKIGENFRFEYFEKYRELEVPIPDYCDK